MESAVEVVQRPAGGMPAHPEKPARRVEVKSRPRKRFLILGAVALATLLAAGLWRFLAAGKESTDDAQMEADVVPVATRVAGQVQKLAARDNQHVKKGDLILQLDDADFAARLAQAQAELETATAQASLARAEAEERKATLELQRARELRAANVVPQSKLDDDQSASDVARAALLQARAALDAPQSRIGEAQGRLSQSAPVDQAIAVAQANSRLGHVRERGADATLVLARLQLSYTRVLAPEDGQITRLTVREGQMVQPGQPLAALVPDTTYLVANFKETQIGQMQPGQAVEVEVDAYGGRKLAGKVESLSGGTGSRFSLLPPDNASATRQSRPARARAHRLGESSRRSGAAARLVC